MFKITARTVLELGSELISTDIIAFYELVKNAFDAKSKSGAEIQFHIVMRRNAYLRIRDQAVEMSGTNSGSKRPNEVANLLGELLNSVSKQLDVTAGIELADEFNSVVAPSKSIREFIANLDRAYRDLNKIIILDSGSGMSLEELSTNYLTIGTPSRKREVDKAIANKEAKTPFLGEKGIGRLSAMRLGDRLVLTTARKSDLRYNKLDIDWRDFNDINAMIEDIEVEPTVGNKKMDPAWSGTTLEISDLAEDWTSGRIQGLADYEFARLTDPFVDLKMRPRIALVWNETRLSIPWMHAELIKASHAVFRGKYTITENGPELRVDLEARDLGYKHPLEKDSITLTLPDLEGLLSGTHENLPTSALTSVGEFDFEAYWYNRKNLTSIDTIGNQKAVRDLLRKWSGISLYRDGFRVFPYGEDEDDWLGLDRKALGRPGYVLNKTQFVGHVRISRSKNPGLIDQTNREGLRATPEQGVFVNLLQHVVRDMLWSFFRGMDRKYKSSPVDLSNVKAEISSLESRAKNALSRVRKLIPKDDLDTIDELEHTFVEFKELVSRAQIRAEQVEDDSRQMLQMAGVGLMVEVVAHELARATEGALHALEGLRGKDLPAEVRAKLDTLKAEMKSVSKRLRVLDQMSVSGRQRAEVFDIGGLLEDLKEGHAVQFARHGINMKIHKPTGPLRVKLIKGMVVQILENLISNSIYWTQMRVAKESKYVPIIDVRITADPLTIYFKDNGQGISPDHREKVFEPFWSLKEKSKRRGLGLFIAHENAQHLEGNIILSEKSDSVTGRLNTFIIEFPEGSVQG